jgi:acetyl esterase/lipase
MVMWIVISSILLVSMNVEPVTSVKTKEDQMENNHLSLSDSIGDIVNHPAFRGYGEQFLPWQNNASYYDTSLRNVGRLMPYHSNVRPEVVLSSINFMIDEVNSGKTIFYDFYSEEQNQQDPSKNQTGLFFFRGEPGAPFAIICPGGGFRYVGSLHEGFPLAQEISKQELNAFVLKYRTGSAREATEDLAAAISYIINNAENLGVSTEGYSLWGGSAGARLVGNIALHGVSDYADGNLPEPAAAVIAYTGQSSYSSDFPPTFLTVAENDWIVNASGVERRAQNLRNAGVEVEFNRYDTAGHGFGTGQGTDAEGWMDNAIEFWKKHISI